MINEFIARLAEKKADKVPVVFKTVFAFRQLLSYKRAAREWSPVVSPTTVIRAK